VSAADGTPPNPADLLASPHLAGWLAQQTCEEELERLVYALADVLDSFDRLFAEVPETGSSVRLIARQLEAALRGAGLERTGRVGELAEPRTHEVVEARSDGDVVVAVLRHGCVFKERVLRPAQVIVGSNLDEVTG